MRRQGSAERDRPAQQAAGGKRWAAPWPRPVGPVLAGWVMVAAALTVSAPSDAAASLAPAGSGMRAAAPPHPRLIAVLNVPSRVYSVAFRPNGKILASGGHDKTIRLWAMR